MKNHSPDISEFYRRNLPHIQPVDSVLVITTRLHGSLPREVLEQLREERIMHKENLRKKQLPRRVEERKLKELHNVYFGKFEEILDAAQGGPTWLKEPQIAEIVISALRYFDGDRYKLVCYTIMSNHIHFIFYKLDRKLSTLMHSIKRFSARQANIALNRVGKPFWASESYDHYIRGRAEFIAQIKYILNNPVKAGIVNHWEDYPYSYLKEEFRDMVFGNK